MQRKSGAANAQSKDYFVVCYKWLTKSFWRVHYYQTGMSDFLFSINATLPLFILIALGFFLKKVNILNDSFINVANKFNFTVTLPVLVFYDISKTDVVEAFNLKFLLFCLIVTTLTFWIIWFLARRIFKNNREFIGEFVQASYRSSAAVLGMALIANIYGQTTLGGMMLLGCVPLYNIYAVMVLQFESPDEAKDNKRIKKTLISVCKNPIVIGIALGFISSLLQIEYPVVIDTAISYVARTATPLALICIGGAFSFKTAKETLKPALLASAIKIIIIPVIFVIIAILLGFRNEALIAAFIMLGAPTTPSTYIMARQYGHSGAISSSAVVFTTLFSVATMTLFLFVLKSLGYV